MSTPPSAPREPANPAFVALGGGHGLAASLSALRLMTDRITAVVTVADDGGSSGRLREELGVLPPGDLRMALAALCDDSEWGRTWRDLLQHRFATDGPLDHHSVGNLLIVALWQLLGDTVGGLDLVGRLLGARGRVLPMAAVPLEIEADVRCDDGTLAVVRGQTHVAVTPYRIEQLRLHPADPPACPEAVSAVRDADWVVLGPGSWYSSVLPHLLVPELRAALHETPARIVVTLNLTPDDETQGMRAVDHLAVLRAHAPELPVHAVVADPGSVDDVGELADLCASTGTRLLVRQVRRGDQSAVHDPLRLAAALRDVVEGYLGDVGTPAGR
ncbi:uridine diphosphate-N-acetylglucosamine-binding protein YvcK [Cellulomonas sp. zg-ZUI222]|uniref:Putative gluconeogenesis factor n=1 Tax=Cellulomonas wangleii TaxID=2816956 RepID=A0ABX8D043_9CELL|nr:MULTISPECIES: uridine diphosphate-N-acetylglucosamine-binding protein YvcK [Cellulomonas]MBO0900257.1 uridine diphosphate-N-acetylglucosamine-binding protein YvcK [Cellulomonas sp. zg-ZUI22]MBO0920829.1 uridine diphosphate-N-acetylglucosamine-binding protein YvcK [Cellulomonas wangleii]MBO0926575.1 uridine diphosphate-N-acetylglucosamine-binding protein YvcK [Cellulomonas wangleii]QVI60863.1 uridine diphosphate-N-acetylglucosamine-binding protein YvcK [Cellulomonas wangleii]